MRAVSGIWRWRHNPLRRGTDLCEAWLALAALLLMLLAAPAAGLMSASLTDDALQQAVRAQRDRRHLTTAVVVRQEEAGEPAAPLPGLVEAARRLVVWRMMQRRYVRLGQAWAKAGPDWGRTGTGS